MPKTVKSLSVTVQSSFPRLCIHPRFEREAKDVVLKIAFCFLLNGIYIYQCCFWEFVVSQMYTADCIFFHVFSSLCVPIWQWNSEEFLFYWVTKGANMVDCEEYVCCLSAVVDSCAFYVNEVLKQLFIFQDLVFPDDSTVLDASSSHDDQKIVSYHWEQSRWVGTNKRFSVVTLLSNLTSRFT